MLPSFSNQRSILRAAIGGSAALLIACSGGVSQEELPQEYAAALCQPFSECAPELYANSAFGSGQCEELLATQFRNTTMAAWNTAIERGTASYDGAAAACLDGLRALGCDVIIGTNPAACEDILQGTVAEGEACSLHVECAGDAYCAEESCPGTAGTCTARKAAGEACTSDTECTTGLVCEEETCGAPRSSRDGACGGPDDLRCPLDQVCVGDTDETAGTCTDVSALMTAAVGETCEPQSQETLCQSGLSCAVVSAGAEGVVAECKERVGAGETCQVAVPSMCPADHFCDASPAMTGSFDGTCVALPGEGMPCGGTSGRQCAAGLACLIGETENTCIRQRGNGESCSEDVECYSDNCDGGTCAGPELCAP